MHRLVSNESRLKISNIYSKISILFIIYLIAISNLKINILSLIAILISTVFILNPIYILPPLLISCLIGEYFVAFSGVGMSRIMTTVFIVGAIYKFIINNIKIKISDILFILFFCSFNIISAKTSTIGSITPAITMILNTFLLYSMKYIEIDNLNVFFKTISTSIIILTVYIFYITISGQAAEVGGRLVLDEAVNSNRLGMALAQVGALLYGILVCGILKKRKFIHIITLFLAVISLFYTGSRSALIAITGAIILMTLFSLFKKEKISKRIAVLLLAIVSIAIVFMIISNSNLEITERFSISSIKESGGSGRVDIWKVLFKYVIPENLLIGVGLGGENVSIEVASYLGKDHGTHNLLITIIAQTGIIGCIIYGSIFFKTTLKLFKLFFKYSNLAMPLMMIVTAFINGIGEDIFTERYLWFALGLGAMLINNLKLEMSKK